VSECATVDAFWIRLKVFPVEEYSNEIEAQFRHRVHVAMHFINVEFFEEPRTFGNRPVINTQAKRFGFVALRAGRMQVDDCHWGEARGALAAPRFSSS